jgi:tetratricopeptide (TPR) repeat protein
VLGWQKTAQELTDQGNISQAYEYYQKIIQFNADSSDLSVMRKSLPTMPRDVFSLGKLFENDAQYDKALELYQAGVNWPVSGDKSQGIWNDPAF